MSNQDFDETLSQVITHALNRLSSSKAADRDALIQEYGDWLKCLGNPHWICRDILYINTLTFKDRYLKS